MPQPVATESLPAPTTMTPVDRPTGGLARRFAVVAGELAVVAVIWVLLKYGFGITFDLRLVSALAAAIVLGGIVPERFGPLATGVGIIGVAALEYLYFGNVPLAAVLGVFAALNVMTGVARLKDSGRR